MYALPVCVDHGITDEHATYTYNDGWAQLSIYWHSSRVPPASLPSTCGLACKQVACNCFVRGNIDICPSLRTICPSLADESMYAHLLSLLLSSTSSAEEAGEQTLLQASQTLEDPMHEVVGRWAGIDGAPMALHLARSFGAICVCCLALCDTGWRQQQQHTGRCI